MTILIFILAIASILHFIYESIIAPSLRMHLRNKLFELRDEARAIRAEGVSEEDEEAFWYTHDGINNLLDRLSWLTLHARISTMHTFRDDPELQALVKKRKAMLDSCKDQRIKDMFKRTSVIVEEAFIVNMGAWYIYLLPIVLLCVSLGSLKSLAGSLILTPDKKRDEILPKPVLAY